MTHLEYVRTLPCVCCARSWWLWLLSLPEAIRLSAVEGQAQMGWKVRGPSEAAHVGLSTSVRGMSQKYPDDETIPLCAWDHREGKESHHSATKTFFSRHDLPRDAIIREIQRLFLESKTSKPVEF